ncbi:hypothetical protein CSUI_005954, partial [Cystoisospora suis]
MQGWHPTKQQRSVVDCEPLRGEKDTGLVAMPLVPAQIGSAQVMALIDTGATNSFVNPRVVNTWG